MNDNQSAGREYNWDDEISQDSAELALLPEGEYEFSVTGFERGRYPGGAKLPSCPKATVSLRFEGVEGVAVIKHNFFLHSKCEGLLCAFFTCLGMRKRGEPLRMDWPGTVGRTGRAKITVRSYTGNDGREYQTNDVKQFLEPENAPAAPAAAQSWTPGAF
mgnify:FL=1